MTGVIPTTHPRLGSLVRDVDTFQTGVIVEVKGGSYRVTAHGRLLGWYYAEELEVVDP